VKTAREDNWSRLGYRQLPRAALGLTKAVQYGIDRYPAIVFDGQAEVFGIADVEQAFHRYRQWREDVVR
jgi:integrating conjugative element protein (TIGR03757 family)